MGMSNGSMICACNKTAIEVSKKRSLVLLFVSLQSKKLLSAKFLKNWYRNLKTDFNLYLHNHGDQEDEYKNLKVK